MQANTSASMHHVIWSRKVFQSTKMSVAQFVKECVVINLPDKGLNSVVTVKDVAESGVDNPCQHDRHDQRWVD